MNKITIGGKAAAPVTPTKTATAKVAPVGKPVRILPKPVKVDMRSAVKDPKKWLFANQWTMVKSSNVKAIKYHHAARKLYVMFKSGDIYPYHGVPPKVADEMFRCDSMGRYVRQKLRDKYFTDGPL